MSRAVKTPILIRDGQPDLALARVTLGDLEHNEAWLQDLIARHPELLPVQEIEPSFERLILAGREVSCGHGQIDNLYITGGGAIVVVEAKLHANPQARREVVAQAMDYVAALSGMTFEQFERAVCGAQHPEGAPATLYDLVRGQADALDEGAFVDAVTGNLSRGRLLAIVVGDKIRSQAETLVDALQAHAGSHCTFALVELSIYRNDEGMLLIVPAVLLQTLMVERAVVRVEQGGRCGLKRRHTKPT